MAFFIVTLWVNRAYWKKFGIVRQVPRHVHIRPDPRFMRWKMMGYVQEHYNDRNASKEPHRIIQSFNLFARNGNTRTNRVMSKAHKTKPNQNTQHRMTCYGSFKNENRCQFSWNGLILFKCCMPTQLFPQYF